VEQVQCFVHLVVRLASVVGTTIGVSKINYLKVLVVPFFLLTLLVSNEEVNLL